MKIINKALIASVLFASSLSIFAEDGWKFDGYFKFGLNSTVPTNEHEDPTLDMTTYTDGSIYGNGKSNLRLNASYNKDHAGFFARYETEKFDFKNTDALIKPDTIKYIYGYANFFNDILGFEGGKILDTQTLTSGKKAYGFYDDKSYGIRILIRPIEGLTFGIQGTSLYYKPENSSFNFSKDLFGFSAKYTCKDFNIAAGYHLADAAYAGFGYTGVKNMKLTAEVKYLGKDLSGKKNQAKDAVPYFETAEVFEYNFKDVGPNLILGLYSLQKWAENNNAVEIYPYSQFTFLKNYVVTEEFSVKYAETNNKWDFSETSALGMKLSKALLRAYYTVGYDTTSKQIKNNTGLGLKVTF